MSLLNKTCFLMTCFSITGCIVYSDFYYMSFEGQKDISVIEKRFLDVGRLTDNSVIPVQYKLIRDDYTLLLKINDGSYFPNITVDLISSKYANVSIVPIRDKLIKSYKGVTCTSIESESGLSFSFLWSSDCISNEDKFVKFNVINNDTDILFKESLSFDLVKDGKYYSIDAL